jgi:hypothetical protein
MCLAVGFGGGDKRAHWGQKVLKVGLAGRISTTELCGEPL